MELKINVRYPQVLELIGQLPEQDIQKLVRHFQGKFANPAKDRISVQWRTPIQELVMHAPTWTEEEYSDYLESRLHINQSRRQQQSPTT
jgi:hypothetical protein